VCDGFTPFHEPCDGDQRRFPKKGLQRVSMRPAPRHLRRQRLRKRSGSGQKQPDRTFTEPCANACPRLRQAPRMMKAVLEREYQCQCRGSWRRLFPNAAVLALRHAPADSDNRIAFDEPDQAAEGTVVRHSEQIICLPAEPDKLVSEIAKQERCVIDCRFPNDRRHAWRALGQ
jgi:hypothetical protein